MVNATATVSLLLAGLVTACSGCTREVVVIREATSAPASPAQPTTPSPPATGAASEGEGFVLSAPFSEWIHLKNEYFDVAFPPGWRMETSAKKKGFVVCGSPYHTCFFGVEPATLQPDQLAMFLRRDGSVSNVNVSTLGGDRVVTWRGRLDDETWTQATRWHGEVTFAWGYRGGTPPDDFWISIGSLRTK
jgi:hypothetical protein